MTISSLEQQCDIPVRPGHDGLLAHFQTYCSAHAGPSLVPTRFAVTSTDSSSYHCEFATLSADGFGSRPLLNSIFGLHKRRAEPGTDFNVVLAIPTGIGAELGGHAGDAGPVANLLAEVSDRLVLHPNVVNASDLNEMPTNAWYVEGSVLARLLMGTVGLRPVRRNRVLVVVDAHQDEVFVNATVVIPPARTANVSAHGPRSPARDRTIQLVKQLGRRRWKKASGYHRQGRVENTFFRYKSIIGDGLRARSPAGQGSEVVLGCEILNRMTALGRPVSYRIGR